MAENKKGFMLYADQKALFYKLPNEKAGELIKHIFAYVNDESPINEDLLIEIAFEPIKQQLKRDLKKWESKAEHSRINGLKGGRPKNPTEPEKPSGLIDNPTEPKKPVKDNVTVTVKDTVKDIKIKIPAYEEFKTYALSKDPDININALKLKYESWVENDWRDGNDKKIKNWKSKILNTISYLPKDVSAKKSYKNVNDAWK